MSMLEVRYTMDMSMLEVRYTMDMLSMLEVRYCTCCASCSRSGGEVDGIPMLMHCTSTVCTCAAPTSGATPCGQHGHADGLVACSGPSTHYSYSTDSVRVFGTDLCRWWLLLRMVTTILHTS